MERENLNGVRLRGVDWFSWATAGGSSVVILTAEVGVAEILVTRERALVLTNEIESGRMKHEEIGRDYEVVSSAWDDPQALDRIARDFTGGGAVASDRPRGTERPLPPAIAAMKLRLCAEETVRYRKLGADSAEAMTDALLRAQPGWSEWRLAAEGARELMLRGIHPTLVLVGGEERVEHYRHPFPTAKNLGGRAMMVFCARRHGLYANLTRFISFREPTALENERMSVVAQIESAAFTASVPGTSLPEAYAAIKDAYGRAGYEEETAKQHFGGTTGYLSRESFARPQSEGEIAPVIRDHTAVAWNPTLPGSKIEDTVLVTDGGLEILTVDARWPTFELGGRRRPQVLLQHKNSERA
jgi:Xaa-Pro aminopeptidase